MADALFNRASRAVKQQILFSEGWKYRLEAQYEDVIPIHPPNHIRTEYITLLANGYFVIKKGYASDGPSGPTIDTPSAMRGSFIHDALFQLIRAGLLPDSFRAEADELYKNTCIEDGMPKIRAWLHFKALRLFGANAARPSSESQILTAP